MKVQVFCGLSILLISLLVLGTCAEERSDLIERNGTRSISTWLKWIGVIKDGSKCVATVLRGKYLLALRHCYEAVKSVVVAINGEEYVVSTKDVLPRNNGDVVLLKLPESFEMDENEKAIQWPSASKHRFVFTEKQALVVALVWDEVSFQESLDIVVAITTPDMCGANAELFQDYSVLVCVRVPAMGYQNLELPTGSTLLVERGAGDLIAIAYAPMTYSLSGSTEYLLFKVLPQN